MFKKLLILMGAVALVMLIVFVMNNTGTKSTNSDADNEQLIDALRVGVHYNVKKMGYQEYYDEDVEGFEVDLAKQLAKQIYGKESLIELSSVSMKTAKHYLNNKTVDCVVATQPITGQKDDTYKYSDPYYTDYIECLYNQGNIMSINDLAGKKIGVITDSYAHKKLEELLKNAKIEAEFISYESYPDGLEAVQYGKLDVFCMARIFLPNTSLKRFTVTECKYAVMVRAEDTDLLNKINSAIKNLSDSGELSLLIDKYK